MNDNEMIEYLQDKDKSRASFTFTEGPLAFIRFIFQSKFHITYYVSVQK
jgi:hypothetical protein